VLERRRRPAHVAARGVQRFVPIPHRNRAHRRQLLPRPRAAIGPRAPARALGVAALTAQGLLRVE
jgi:hypothetical protein